MKSNMPFPASPDQREIMRIQERILGILREELVEHIRLKHHSSPAALEQHLQDYIQTIGADLRSLTTQLMKVTSSE